MLPQSAEMRLLGFFFCLKSQEVLTCTSPKFCLLWAGKPFPKNTAGKSPFLCPGFRIGFLERRMCQDLTF